MRHQPSCFFCWRRRRLQKLDFSIQQFSSHHLYEQRPLNELLLHLTRRQAAKSSSIFQSLVLPTDSPSVYPLLGSWAFIMFHFVLQLLHGVSCAPPIFLPLAASPTRYPQLTFFCAILRHLAGLFPHHPFLEHGRGYRRAGWTGERTCPSHLHPPYLTLGDDSGCGFFGGHFHW